MGLNGLTEQLKANRRLIRGISFVMGTCIAVCGINAGDLGASDSVDLQSPSMDLKVTEYAYDESLSCAKSNVIDINDYTLMLSADSVIADEGYSYDGKSYSIKAETLILKEASPDSEQLGTLSEGDIVVRLSYCLDWSLVRTEDGTEGYIQNNSVGEAEAVVIPEDEEEEKVQEEKPAANNETPAPEEPAQPEQTQPEPVAEEPSFTETGCSMTVYASCGLNTRTGPGISYTKVTTLSTGTAINVVAQTDNGWYKTDSGSYVKASLCIDSMPTPTPVPEVTEAPSEQPASDPGESASDFPSYCKSYIGVPYVYSGSSPSGFDCSGFVKYCFLNYYGVYLPHSAHSQSQLGTEVSADQIAVGDIVCFDYDGDGRIDHSGIYIGGDTVVHASSSKGQVVASTFSAMTGIATIRRVL
ncbi:MAG: C40 family peptidase [Saccharofermentans sp.]|nr:C40 family peptidase [Saccharofermentans sp.]